MTEALKNEVFFAQHGVWTAAYINDLPDGAFAYIEPGGKKDETGRTKPRSKRHLPYKNKEGETDKAHVRNALARLKQTHIKGTAKSSALGKLQAAARKVGVESEIEMKKEGCGSEKVRRSEQNEDERKVSTFEMEIVEKTTVADEVLEKLGIKKAE